VDGKPAEIERVEGAFRGVRVTAGKHRIEMRYEPGSYRVGMFVSLVALALVVGAALPLRRARAAATASRS